MEPSDLRVIVAEFKLRPDLGQPISRCFDVVSSLSEKSLSVHKNQRLCTVKDAHSSVHIKVSFLLFELITGFYRTFKIIFNV